jgi:hypothetical protein
MSIQRVNPQTTKFFKARPNGETESQMGGMLYETDQIGSGT